MEARRVNDPPLVGPWRADMIRPGEPYEVSDGYRIECMTTGERGGASTVAGAAILGSDPAAESIGIDVGVSPVPTMLRAPDISVGNIQADKPGWATKVPPLAVEYADTGQDERELQKKILELLRFGTRLVWVVRLTGPRRVEVHAPGREVETVLPGASLEAPGILKNPVPVEALYDREAAHRHTLKNLLQRQGYEDLDAVRAEGLREGLRRAIRDLCEVLAITPSPAQEAMLDALDLPALEVLREQIKRERRWL